MDIASVSAVVAAGGVIVGVVLAMFELRNLAKMRQMDLLMRMHSEINSKDKLQAWIAIVQSETKEPSEFMAEHLADVLQVAVYYEELGILIGKKLLDAELITDIIGAGAVTAWSKLDPVIRFRRKQYNNPKLYEWFEYLYNVMKKRGQTLQTKP